MKTPGRRWGLKPIADRILASHLTLQSVEESRKLAFIAVKVELPSAGCLRQSIEHRLAAQISNVERILVRQSESEDSYIIPERHLQCLRDGRPARGIFAICYEQDDAAGLIDSGQLVSGNFVDCIENRCPAFSGNP